MTRFSHVIATLAFALVAQTAAAADAGFHHLHLTVTNGDVAARWYIQHLGCVAVPTRTDAARCGDIQLLFIARPAGGGNEGTALDHIAFSVTDLDAKVKQLLAVGVGGSGVRVADRESPIHEEPGLFRYAFIKDPWGTKIELVQDPELVGFHHLHMFSADPAATLKWYETTFGGRPAVFKNRLNGLVYGKTWLIVGRNANRGPLQPSDGRTIDHIGFTFANGGAATTELAQKGAQIQETAEADSDGQGMRAAMLKAPDGLRVEAIVGLVARAKESGDNPSAAAKSAAASWTAPRTPWGEPDLEGIWTVNDTHGVPLERPADLGARTQLTATEAAARRERATQSGIWGYDREWRDTALGFVKTNPSQQVALIVDPPDGKVPALTPQGRKRVADRAANGSGLVEGSNEELRPGLWASDLSPYVRCITRGLPDMWLPIGYNNGVQIVQGPGYVVITKEMIHEARVIPTDNRTHVGSKITTWLGDSRGHWEGDTLVVEVTNFNGKVGYRGSDTGLRLTERYTRTAADTIDVRVTIEDPDTWTRPWTINFPIKKDDGQYELVEYSCHEGNYGLVNILSGARADEKKKAAPAARKSAVK
jgi:catechol 2,3-dioxygenase-like lactoylglutathione lyase family enzyme